MSGIFSITPCSRSSRQSVSPEPVKFRFLKAINLFDPILKALVLPSLKEKYLFPQDHLHFVTIGEDTHIPIVYFPAPKPKASIVLVYSHGSGSTLNNVFGLGLNLMTKYGIAVVLYDYNGEGESKGKFQSYEKDIKIVLSWVFKQGYSPSRTVLCGFSIGSFPTLTIPGPMPRILVSPICGLTPLVEGTNLQY